MLSFATTFCVAFSVNFLRVARGQLAVDYTQDGVPRKVLVKYPNGVAPGQEFQAPVPTNERLEQ